jgi:KilA-N domain/Protein of unknown function (DUF3627)
VIIQFSKLPISFKKKMTSELAFQQIKGNYWYAAYGEFKVVMDKSNGYINATRMCALAGKEFKPWKRNVLSQKLMHDLQNQIQGDMVLANTQLSIENSDLPLGEANGRILPLASFVCKKVFMDKSSEYGCIISGTYCHPDLIPHIACWVSPSFALKVSRIINGYSVNEYKAKLNDMQLQLQASSESELKHKQAKLEADELREAATLDVYLAQQQQRIAEQQAHHLETTVRRKKQELDVWASTHAFTMMRLNNSNAKMPYYAVRRKQCNMSRAIKKLRAKHPNSIMIYQRRYVPNPINLYNRLKACGILCFNGNYCHASVPEGELIDKLEKVYSITE